MSVLGRSWYKAQVQDEDLIGRTLADRYRVERLIGAGAMGRVYQAQHIHMRKQVALKILHQRLSNVADMVQRFEQEAQAAAQVQHPHVAAATDFGKLPDGSFYLVLEYIEGIPLSELIKAGPLSLRRALSIVLQVTSALEAAHALGIVHRDLKPDNLLLVHGAADGQHGAAQGQHSAAHGQRGVAHDQQAAAHDYIKVLDFGIAKLPAPTDGADKPLTLAGMVYGTPEYMAPEQALGQQVDGRADIYALGVVFFEMLAGRRPYIGPAVSLLGQQLSKPLPRMAEFVSMPVPREVEELLGEMLAPEPKNRIADVKLLTVRLVQLETSLETLASAPSPRWRSRALALSAGLVVLSALSAWHFGRKPQTQKSPLAAPLLLPPPRAEDDALASTVSDEMEEKLRLAKAQGMDALLSLAKAHPGEGIIQAELALEYALTKQYTLALQAASAALALDPKLNENPKVSGALFRTTQAHEVRAASFRLLTGPMGAAGVNIIYDLAHTKGVQARVRAEAEQLLARADVQQVAAPSLRLVMDLEAAQSCEDFLPLVRRAAVVGDRRALPQLVELSRTTGCDPKEQGDCYTCLRGDNSLAEAITTIKQRSTLSDGAEGP